MATFLRDKAPPSLLGIEALQKLEVSIDIKDLVCITLGISLPVSLFDGLDFVHSLTKWPQTHVALPRHIECFLSLGRAITCLIVKHT